ncbi:FkbM family methyltransferase [Pendulispora rubella]|uniref:FkbM family methyltransferase n=1 Tax=Pendulispora rubella TaxID=2741070 RepID=A0ABZ2KXH7_9BACT
MSSSSSSICSPRIAFLFPGLGEQYVHMAAELYQTEPVFRGQIDTCCDIVTPLLDIDLRTVLYPARCEPLPASPKLDLRAMLRRGPRNDALDRTDLAQPATFVVEYALAQLWMARGVQPDAMLGYSIGEYVAACLAEVLSLPEALRLVTRRAQLIQRLPEGAMLAVPLPERAIENLLGERVSLAAVNGASLCVLAGTTQAIEAIEARWGGSQQPAVRIPTTHAFHSKMMEPAAGDFLELVKACSLRAPRIPYISNVTGTWITAAQATNPAYWVEHLCKPVRFGAGLEVLRHAPGRVFLEVGPGRALSTLAVQHGPAFPSLPASYEGTSDQDVLKTTWERLHSLDRPQLFTDYAPAQDEWEQRLVHTWQEVLKTDRVGIHDNFFERGGHSLLAISILQRLENAWGIQASLSLFFEHPTIAQFARAVNPAHVVRPASHGEPTAHSLPYRLPNGWEITHQNKAETDHFYEDIFEHRTYTRHLNELPENACVFDVGANIGLFSLFVHGLGRNATVYAFEPSAPTFDILRRNLSKHGVRAKLFDMGLSNAERTADFTFYPHSSGMSSVYGNADEEKAVLRAILQNQMDQGTDGMNQVMEHSEALLSQRVKGQHLTCRLRTLSGIVREEGIERIDLLKIDVQKSELDVLLGIEPADWPKIRALAIEVHDIEGRVQHIEQWLVRQGYDVTTEQDELYRDSGIYLIYAQCAAGASSTKTPQ